jgi:hypothetical protein
MDIRETIIAWNPNKDEIEFGPILEFEKSSWVRNYLFTAGAAYVFVKSLSDIEAEVYVLTEAISKVVFDGMTPAYVHKAFKEIKQYRDVLQKINQQKIGV